MTVTEMFRFVFYGSEVTVTHLKSGPAKLARGQPTDRPTDRTTEIPRRLERGQRESNERCRLPSLSLPLLLNSPIPLVFLIRSGTLIAHILHGHGLFPRSSRHPLFPRPLLQRVIHPLLSKVSRLPSSIPSPTLPYYR